MTSHYARDPRVPPAQVERLGKHRRSRSHGPVGLPAAAAPAAPAEETPPKVEPKRRSADAGPTYDDFLEHDGRDEQLPDKTG